jgi:para-nitrobenzyl esterase
MRLRSEAIVGIVLFALATPAATMAQVHRPRRHAMVESDIVHVEQGPLRGSLEGDVVVFRGVPFAAPPVGALRWLPPEPPAPWAGVRDALDFGPPCPQLDNNGAVVGNEDCLQLNVWTPAARSPGERLPVMMFIHGGGHVQGSATVEAGPGQILYNGAEPAVRGGVVVVTVQYRLGALGYVSIPQLDAERSDGGSGNLGTLDLVAALGWLHRNVAAFGGDPGRVMVFGESAGAVETCMLLVATPAAGLFSSALMESGACNARSLSDAHDTAAQLVAAAGCSGAADVAACMRALPADAVVLALPSPATIIGPQGPYQPVVDGVVIPDDPLTMIAAGRHHKVPFVVGANAQETGRDAPLVMSDADYRAAVLALAGGSQSLANLILARYPVSEYGTPRAAYVALSTDVEFVCNARRIARAARTGQNLPVWRYYFARAYQGGSALVEGFGAFHGAELPYVFGDLQASGYDPPPEEQALSDAIIGAWTSLAANGDPGAVQGVPWPQYASGDDPYLRLDVPVTAGDGVRTDQCDFWDTVAGSN